MKSPRQLGNGFGGKFQRFSFESVEPVRPAIREQLRGAVQSSVRKLQEGSGMAWVVKHKGAQLNIGGQLNLWKFPPQVDLKSESVRECRQWKCRLTPFEATAGTNSISRGY
jgi:hypothetical protein